MARDRVYRSNAQRQKAYRERLKAGMIAPKQPAKKQSRPQRLKKTIEELESLSDEYQNWLDALPENLSQGEMAGQLEEAIEQLDEAIELLEGISLPRGFGRG